MRTIKSAQGQWLGDVVVRYAGSLEVLIDVAFDNDLSITDDLLPGTDVIIETVDKRVVNYLERNAAQPATALINKPKGEGVGYWAIEEDFIIC